MKTTSALLLFLCAWLFAGGNQTAVASPRRICATLETQTSAGSGLSAIQGREVAEFMRVNGHPIGFKILTNSIQYAGTPAFSQVLSSRAEGCFDSSLLRIGANEFKISIAWPADSGVDLAQIKGTGKAQIFIGNQLICTRFFGAGLDRTSGCDETRTYDLQEIDPELVGQVSKNKELSQAVMHMRGTYSEIKAAIARLQAKLESIAGKTFEQLLEEDFSGFENELREAISLLHAHKASSGDLQQHVEQSLNTARQKSIDIEARVHQEARNAGISLDVLDVSIPEIDDVDFKLAEKGDGTDPFDSENDPYEALANETIRQVELSWPDKRTDILMIASAWLKKKNETEKVVATRSVISPKEMAAYAASIEKVHTHLFTSGCGGRGCLTQDLWFTDSPVPTDVRLALSQDVKALDQDKAATLEQALKSWKKADITPQHEKILDSVRTLGAATRALAKQNEGVRGLVKGRLISILDSTIAAAKVAGKIAIGFTLAGDCIDFYEAVSGKDFYTDEPLQLWEQALSGVGVIFGSGSFWRALGEEVPSVMRVEKQLTSLERSAAKLERFGPLKKGALHDIKQGSGTVADTFRSSSYFQVVLSQDTKLYRIYTATDGAKKLGKFWSRIKPHGPLQAQLDAAIDPDWNNKATAWVEITVPAGTTWFEGAVAPIVLRSTPTRIPLGEIYGGGNQVYFTNRLDDAWITGGGPFHGVQ